MKVAIHQPEYWPCLPLLAKIKRADMLIILDHVQFKRDSLQQRCKIAGPRPTGVRWLSIPFQHQHPQRIDEVRATFEQWERRHELTIRGAYDRAPRFQDGWPRIQEFFRGCYLRGLNATPRLVADVAMSSMGILADVFSMQPEVKRSSDMDVDGTKGDLVLDICKKVGATGYITGRGGAAYLDPAAFDASGIKITLSEYEVPTYRENQPKDPGLSALDAWMWLGDKAKELLT